MGDKTNKFIHLRTKSKKKLKPTLENMKIKSKVSPSWNVKKKEVKGE